jgi:hypothetical protein
MTKASLSAPASKQLKVHKKALATKKVPCDSVTSYTPDAPMPQLLHTLTLPGEVWKPLYLPIPSTVDGVFWVSDKARVWRNGTSSIRLPSAVVGKVDKVPTYQLQVGKKIKNAQIKQMQVYAHIGPYHSYGLIRYKNMDLQGNDRFELKNLDYQIKCTRDTAPILTVDLKKCAGRCGAFKDRVEFGNNISTADGLQAMCKKCQMNLYATKEGFLSQKLASARFRANSNSLIWTGKFDLDEDYVRYLSTKCCFYSGLPQTVSSYSQWQMSLERLLTPVTYTKTNVVSCCLKFNTRNQWTAKKFAYAFERDIKHEMRTFSDDTFEAMTRKPRMKIVKTAKQVRCNGCSLKAGVDVFKNYTDFGSNVAKGCTNCIRSLNETWRGALQELLRNAISRGSKMQRKSCTLTFEDLVSMLRAQGGLCEYLQVPLSPRKGDWCVSLERRNSSLPYTLSNCCLICQEVNCSDRSAQNSDDDSEMLNWSREIVEEVRQFRKNELAAGRCTPAAVAVAMQLNDKQ